MNSNVKEVAWRGEPLRRGRHKLGPDEVRESQRGRLLRAMVECVAEYGLEGTTVPKVVAAARVSGTAFYGFFSDKADCFLAACDEVAGELLGELVALAEEPDWIQAMRRGARHYLRWWQERPVFARAYLLSLPASEERAREQRERVYESFRLMFADLGRRARAEQPDLPPLSPIVPRALVLAITGLVTEEVAAGRTDRLHELEDDVARLAIRLLADDATAARAATAARSRTPREPGAGP